MKRSLFLIMVVFVIFSCTTTSIDPSHFEVKFGILDEKFGEPNIKNETRTIPFITKKDGQIFGFRISPPSNVAYKCYFIIYFPEEPKILTGSMKKESPSQAKQGIRSKTYRNNTVTYIRMGFDEGDPLGLYKVDLYIDDKLFDTFEFKVIRP